MREQAPLRRAPELVVREWLNSDHDLSLADLRGKVVLVEVFQMLCPGCVSHSLPQAMKVTRTFSNEDVAVIGLHSVFEHHAAQGSREALQAFLHEYRIDFPVAIDAPSSDDRIPQTMARYQMRGTPTLLLIDRLGRLRKHDFGRTDDLKLGAELMALIGESAASLGKDREADEDIDPGCDDEGCSAPV